jgi:hypothetical protein
MFISFPETAKKQRPCKNMDAIIIQYGHSFSTSSRSYPPPAAGRERINAKYFKF